MAAHFNDDDDDLWELAESYMDLFPLRRRVSPLTDLDEVEFRSRFQKSGFVNNSVSMTMKLVLSSIDMNIHVYAKLAGHDVT